MNAIANSSMFLSSNLRRVRRDEVRATAFIKPDGLELCLSCWKEWIAHDPDRDMGVKTTGIFKDATHKVDKDGNPVDEDGNPIKIETDIYEAQQAVDNQIGAATDAMINSLSRMHAWAIYRSCSIASVWRFPNANLAEIAAEAKEQLTEKLKRNVCTATLF